jgi:hypothetical protein
MGLISTAFAAEKSQKEKYYAQYEKIVEEAEQQYNIELTLQPIDKFDENNMLTPEEFKASVVKNCEELNNIPFSFHRI